MQARLLEHPRFAARLSELGADSDRLWLAAMAAGPGVTVLCAFLPIPFSGQFWAYASVSCRVALYLWARDGLPGRGGAVLWRLFTMGLVAGALELLVDWLLVHSVASGRLVYLGPNDVVLLASPAWMPLAWACVIVELGYPALRLYALTSRAALATVVIASSAAVTVGLYEVLAARIGWWRYEPARFMLGPDCALYIPLGEFLMFLPILPIAARLFADEERPVSAAIEAGARFAASIALGYGLAYLLLEAW